MSSQAAAVACGGPAVASMTYFARSMSLPLLASWSACRLRLLSMELYVMCASTLQNLMICPTARPVASESHANRGRTPFRR